MESLGSRASIAQQVPLHVDGRELRNPRGRSPMSSSRKALLVGGAAGLLVLVSLAVLIFRPAAILGVRAAALGHSVQAEVRSVEDHGQCQRRTDSRWICRVRFEPDLGSGGPQFDYHVVVDSLGCWRATRISRARSWARPPTEPAGCIDLLDL